MDKKSYQRLVEEMIEHDKRYYDEAAPLISDYEYDQKMKQLIAYEKKHPEEADPRSPSQRIGEGPTQGFVQKAHLAPMLSLANTYTEEEIEEFLKRVEKLSGVKNIPLSAELKMDGTAISLRYEKGKFVSAVTRGNGRVGDDVTANVRTIATLPLELKGPHLPDLLEVRGEIFMSLSTFQALNQEREEGGLEPFANPRNAAAGSLKLLDPKEVAKRRLHLLCYAIAEGYSPADTQHETIALLKKWGLPTAKPEHLALCKSLEEVMEFSHRIEKERKKLPFEIDGIVLKLDPLKYHEELGVTGKSPRYAIAYKFAPEQAVTQIEEITIQVGRTGVLTPVAELKPVLLSGSTISRATLHNGEEVARKDIREGDWVTLEKGGDVIPKVVGVDLSKRPPKSHPFHMPKQCPACESPVVHREGEVAIRCPNPHCSGKNIRRLIYFASKQALDIDHLGQKVVELLAQKGLVSRPSDFFALTADDLAKLDGFKEKSIQNLLESLERAKECTLGRFIMALGIPHVGTETAELLAENAGSLKALMGKSSEELQGIQGIGEKTAEAIADYFANRRNQEEIELLLKHGVRPKKSERDTSHPFSGKRFVLTGSLTHFTRDEAERLIRERGGAVTSSVSGNVDYVVVGEEPGSKYEKAKKLGVPIWSEAEFKARL